MTYYGVRHLADAFRTVPKNTIAIAQDIPEDKYTVRAAPNTRTVSQLLIHIAVSPSWQQECTASAWHRSKATIFQDDS